MLQGTSKVYPDDNMDSRQSDCSRRAPQEEVHVGQQKRSIFPHKFSDQKYEELYQSFRQQQQRETYFIPVTFGLLFGVSVIISEVSYIVSVGWVHMTLGVVIVLLNIIIGIPLRLKHVHERLAVIFPTLLWILETLQILFHLIVTSQYHIEYSDNIVWQILLLYLCYVLIPISHVWCTVLSFSSVVVYIIIMLVLHMEKDDITKDFLQQVSECLKRFEIFSPV